MNVDVPTTRRQAFEATRKTARPQRTIVGLCVRGISFVVKGASGEYLLERPDVANGGTVVFLRAFHSAICIVALALAFQNLVDPTRGSHFDFGELRTQLSNIGPVLGAVFAATYAALYTRFASQWTYLAGVYNQIKAAASRKDACPDIIAEWKAGFIEDASELHLLRKPMIASISSTWLQDAAVLKALVDWTPKGAEKLTQMRAQVDVIVPPSTIAAAPKPGGGAA